MSRPPQVDLVGGLSTLFPPDQLLFGAAAARGYDCDAYTVDKSKPSAIVLPKTTAEVVAVVKWCNQNKIPFTARGAGTGLSGGALAALGGVIVSTKKLNQILCVDLPNRRLKAQTGAVNKKLTDTVKHLGLHFAPDPSSQSVSTLGGNIGENAGGPHTLKYGVTYPHILGVTMVMPNGEVVEFGGGAPGAPGIDFLGVIVGSEGTLGIVTEAWVNLTPLPEAVETALVAFSEIRQATQTVADIIAAGAIPAALEMMDHGILKAVKAAFGFEYPDGTQALLLIECDGNPENARKEIEIVRAICEKNGALDIRLAENETERAKLWHVRKKGVGAMGRLAPCIVTHDGVIPRSKLPQMLEKVYEIAAKHNLGVANLFHAGDGNLHPCFYFDDRDPKQVEHVVEAGEEIIKLCIDLGGSVSGEHGIGVEKADLMHLMFTPEDLEMQAKVKAVFNDGELCNPCKILPNQKSCVEHKKRWRGMAW